MAAQRPLVDHLLDGLAWLVGHGLYRTVEVAGADRIPRDQPLVIVANHFNGLVDAVLLAVIVRGVPRFVAKGTLWRSPFVRPFLAVAGLVPAGRPEDHDGGTFDNATLFDRAHTILRRSGTLAIFPEGTTHDHLELQRVRTGAARIALGARDVGVDGVTVVPIGLTFDDKLALRSRVLARVGQPIPVHRWTQRWAGRNDLDPAAVSPERHDAVEALTETNPTRLVETTPRYDDVLDRAMLNRAAAPVTKGTVRVLTALVAFPPRRSPRAPSAC